MESPIQRHQRGTGGSLGGQRRAREHQQVESSKAGAAPIGVKVCERRVEFGVKGAGSGEVCEPLSPQE
jgi:hypothetical protein